MKFKEKAPKANIKMTIQMELPSNPSPFHLEVSQFNWSWTIEKSARPKTETTFQMNCARKASHLKSAHWNWAMPCG